MGGNPNRHPLSDNRPLNNNATTTKTTCITTNNNNTIFPISNPILNPTRLKSKTVHSRYLLSPVTSSSSSSSSSTSSSFSTPRRAPSPIIHRTPTPATKPRSISADRRRASPLRSNDVVDKTIPETRLTATRSLSVSFQGESFSLPVRKTAVTTKTPAVVWRRPGTPVGSRPDQHRWPARIRQVNPSLVSNPNSLLKSFDSSVDEEELCNVVGIRSNNEVVIKPKIELDSSKKMSVNSNETDSDSVSSGSSNSGLTVNSAKFWHSNLPKCHSKISVLPKFGQPKRFPTEAPSPRANSSPMRGLVRSSSPMRGFNNNNNNNNNNSINGRGMGSPSRVRVSLSGGFSETPSVLSYAVDVKRGKVGESQINDAHNLRLLYNKYLQWRFVNARKEVVLSAQRRTVQTNLCNAWNTISNLRESVARKTHRLHLMKQKLKLADILKEQITFLEDWASLDKGHCMSLLGSIEALKGSTLRLPVVDGAITDLQSIKEAIGSAVDVMQAMGSSICSLLSKVEEMNFLALELTKEVSREQALLEQCQVYFTKLAVQQVEYCSLRTHILQDNRTLPLLH